jgi:heavy metal sensor kinase
VTLAFRSRLTLIYAGVVGVLLIASGAVSYRVLAFQLDADIRANLAERTSGLHGYLRFERGKPAVIFDAADPVEAAFVEDATRYYQIFDAASGELLVQSDALRPLGLELTPDEVRQFCDRPVNLDVQTDYGRIRLSNSVLTPADGRRYLLQVGVSLSTMDHALNRFLTLLVISVPAGLIATFLIGRWATRVALTPLTRLAEGTRSIEIGDLGQRLPLRGVHDELDEVAVAFNDTLARLEHAVGEMRQFSTALAHELRTPLAALRGDVEMAMLQAPGEDLRRRFASQLEEIDKLRRLIDQILMLARAEAGEIPLSRHAVDLRALGASLVDQLEPVAQAKDVMLQWEGGGPVVVEGDGEWLKRLVLNLLDNAIKFTPGGGRVAVAVARTGGAARLTVTDTGIGIDPDVKPHIFERFFRADPSRSSGFEGVGLGLSLARWIVERHHGRIGVESEPGKGSSFTVDLPLAAQPSFDAAGTAPRQLKQN